MLTRIIFLALFVQSTIAKANECSHLKGNIFQPQPIPGLISKFYGEVQYGTATIYWKLYEQQTGNHFIIERSENGKDFRALDTVKSLDGLNYKYKDLVPLASAFYRIKNVGVDTVYSDIMRLSTLSGMPQVKISPSPFDVVINVEVNSMINETFSMVLTNSKGEVVNSRELNAEKGSNKVVFDDTVSFLYPDEYTMTVSGIQYLYTQKLLKK